MIAYLKYGGMLGLVLAMFALGYHFGGNEVQVKWDEQRITDGAGALRAITEKMREIEAYERQLTAAQSQDVIDRAELARLRAATHIGILCHRAAPAVSGSDSPTRGEPASSGAVPPDTRLDIDALYSQVADAADTAVADCRAALARWPSPPPP
jgi:hypothetical protein